MTHNSINQKFAKKASVTNFGRISEEYRENQLKNLQFACKQSAEYLKVSSLGFIHG